MAECLRCDVRCVRGGALCPACFAETRLRDAESEARRRATAPEPRDDDTDTDDTLGTAETGVQR